MAPEKLRTATFIDGSFFHRCNVYSRYRLGLGWIKHRRVIDFCHKYLAAVTGTPYSSITSAEARYYDSHDPRSGLDDPSPRQRREDFFLEQDGIKVRRFPMKSGSETSGDKVERAIKKQQAVDVGIATDIVRLAYEGAYDVPVLFAGDGDLYPALDCAASIGKRTLLVYFHFDAWSSDGILHPSTYVSTRLRNAATWCLNLTAIAGLTDAPAPLWRQRQAA